MALENLFWSSPPESDGERPTDPLGLDGMREELSNVLVPCLTGRTWSHEQFFWSLVFIRWATEETDNDDARVRRFLHWERCLKLYWAHTRRKGFGGVNRAREQIKERNAPSGFFHPLLKNPRSQGMFGIHLGPLDKLGLVSEDTISLVDDEIVAGAGYAPELRDGNWQSWTRAFMQAGRACNPRFRETMRKRLAEKMPDLYTALRNVRWRRVPAWKAAAEHIGQTLRPVALLADEFCPWADRLRKIFHDLVRMPPGDAPPCLPPALRAPIPPGLGRWKPLKEALKHWSERPSDQVLAGLHKSVFAERGYDRDLWLRCEDGRRVAFPGRASFNVSPEGSDCRWKNAVQLMGPRE